MLLYLLQIADKLQIDIVAAANEKLALNGARYPAAQARGSSARSDELRRAQEEANGGPS